MILITGGAGSIGSEVARRLVRDDHAVRVMDISEEGLWALRADLPEVNVTLGDVQSLEDCACAFAGVTDVIHCAALKHVDLCETNPMLANRVNVLGTHNVMRCAAEYKTPAVFVSTDKAREAHGVMGITKLQAERVAAHYGASIVRFGNVLGSRGSLIPAVIRHAQAGRPIPVTDPNMTRFFMTIAEAVDLIFAALSAAREGRPRMFTPAKLRSARIGDFVAVCRDLFAPGHPIQPIGARPGETQHEYIDESCSNDPALLMSSDEICTLLQSAGLLSVHAS